MTMLLSLAGVSSIAWPFLIALVIFVGAWLTLMWLALRVGNSATQLENFRKTAQQLDDQYAPTKPTAVQAQCAKVAYAHKNTWATGARSNGGDCQCLSK